MSTQGFSFPPPPPPPPTAQPPSAYAPAQYGQWNGRGAGSRGRGRGHGNRSRGGHAHANGSRSQQPPPSGYNYMHGNFGYPAQPSTSYLPPTPYPHAQSNFQHPHNPPTLQSPQTFPQASTTTPYQALPGYNGPTNLTPSTSYSTPAAPTYPPNIPASQHASPPATPVMMGGVSWGDGQKGPGSYGTAPRNHARGPRASHPHGNHGPKARHVNKRDHTGALGKPKSTAPRCPAPPPVPSFGNPLPSKPPPPADGLAAQNPKKKRKFNQLGLTPKTEEHESSDEEDIDEESKLASSTAPLQFTYRGRTATLQSASDIVAWIAERRKKFPTQARVEEKQKAIEEAKAAREAVRREKEKQKEREKPQKETAGQADGDTADPAIDAAMKAQRKAEKIRRSLSREQKRFAKAEAEAAAARLKLEALQRQARGLPHRDAAPPNEELDASAEPVESSDMDLAPSGSMPVRDVELSPEQVNLVDATVDHVADAIDLSESSDWTSSSGSDSDSDSDSEGSAPEEVSSRREGPERVPPPPREGKKPLCRHFARNGRCNRGNQCKFSHEGAERTKAKVPEKKGRKGLLDAVSSFRVLLDRQKEEEDRRAMEMISWLGQNGLLQATDAPTDGAPSEPPA
ncbi:hypothetical protein N7492_003640 [Penicillium capsulatum]|uniref:C3H1-type domain-containing protein n=1 Tax=Penicillium capsulatum TaxID=69766 RepID=A0A9W9LWR5_9EURO|nr:hypothetical protein N7492_003640 [Penicillium capsulatum]KAJ6121779.1 hypothetical protein N7512_004244 [Penicillium capsulatum]